MVFCNTTPFIALASIGRLELLSQVIGDISVADAVAEECAEGGPISVPPLRDLSWVTVHPDLPPREWTAVLDLDRGEQQTLLLARHYASELVIIDERRARTIGEYLGLRITGTLGILAKAKTDGLLPSFREAAAAMQALGMYYSQGLIDRLAERLGENNRKHP